MLRQGNPYRQQYTAEQLKERWKILGGGTKLNESAGSDKSRATLLHKERAPNGVTYGIIQESGSIYIKTTTKNLNEATALDFSYIGGQENILSERFDSISSAHRRLNLKLNALRESAGEVVPEIKPEEASVDTEKKEDALLNKLDQKTKEDSTPPADGPATEPMTGDADPLAAMGAGATEAPAGDTPAEGDAPAGDAPAEGDAPVGDAPAGDMGAIPGLGDAPAGDAPAEGDAPAGDAPAEGDAPAGDAPAEGDAPAGDAPAEGENPADEAKKLLGKLGVVLRQGEQNGTQAKEYTNTLISSLEDGYRDMSPEDREALIDRIRKGGKKQVDEEAPLGDEPTIHSELPSFEKWLTMKGATVGNDEGVAQALNDYQTEVTNAMAKGGKSVSEVVSPEELTAIGTKLNSTSFSKVQEVNPEFMQALKAAVCDETGKFVGPKTADEAPVTELNESTTKLIRLLVEKVLTQRK